MGLVVNVREEDRDTRRTADVLYIPPVLALRRKREAHEEIPEPPWHVGATHHSTIQTVTGAHGVARVEANPSLELVHPFGIAELDRVTLGHALGKFLLLMRAREEHDRDPGAPSGLLQEPEMLDRDVCVVVGRPAALPARNRVKEG
jgi:hypothetical protein